MCENDNFLTKLRTREIIQGDTSVFAFEFTDCDGSVIIPTASQITWNLCTYDYYEDIVLTISSSSNSSQLAVDSSTGICYVTLSSTNTNALTDGKYIQQPILTYSGSNFIRAWGEVVVRRKVGGS